MHARSGAWRCCDGKERAARVQCELLLAGSFIALQIISVTQRSAAVLRYSMSAAATNSNNQNIITE